MNPYTPHQCPHFGPLMGYCDHQIHTLLDRRLRCLDISPMQSRVLAYLCGAEQEVTQRTLEQILMVKPSTVNGIVSRLEEKGLVRRSISAHDGRCRTVHLTQRGLDANEQIRDAITQVTRQMEQGFSPEELTVLHEMLLRVAENLTISPQEVDK